MNKISAKALTMFIKNKQKRKFVYKLLTNNIKLDDYMLKTKVPLVLGYSIKGENNKIIIIENGVEREIREGEKIEGLDIIINGDNNIIKLELPIKAKNSKIEIGNDNAVVDVGSSQAFYGVFIRCCYGNGQYCKIGKGTTIYGAGFILDADGGCIVGDDCMFSNSIRIWTTDGHSIIDSDSKKILNDTNGYVTIGDHCWVGEAVRITKNARIGNNCIIGGGAVACKDYKEDNCIIAGNPGKIVKRGISWDRKNTINYKNSFEGA